MSYSDESTQIQNRFKSLIGTTPVEYPNISLTPTPSVLWVRLTVLNGESRQTTIGETTNNHRMVGLIVVQIFGEKNKGNSETLAMADAVAAIFRNWCGSTVRCQAATVKEVGPDGLGRYQVNVSVPFKRDELL